MPSATPSYNITMPNHSIRGHFRFVRPTCPGEISLEIPPGNCVFPCVLYGTFAATPAQHQYDSVIYRQRGTRTRFITPGRTRTQTEPDAACNEKRNKHTHTKHNKHNKRKKHKNTHSKKLLFGPENASIVWVSECMPKRSLYFRTEKKQGMYRSGEWGGRAAM